MWVGGSPSQEDLPGSGWVVVDFERGRLALPLDVIQEIDLAKRVVGLSVRGWPETLPISNLGYVEHEYETGFIDGNPAKPTIAHVLQGESDIGTIAVPLGMVTGIAPVTGEAISVPAYDREAAIDLRVHTSQGKDLVVETARFVAQREDDFDKADVAARNLALHRTHSHSADDLESALFPIRFGGVAVGIPLARISACRKVPTGEWEVTLQDGRELVGKPFEGVQIKGKTSLGEMLFPLSAVSEFRR
jgi:hypothetical protein